MYKELLLQTLQCEGYLEVNYKIPGPIIVQFTIGLLNAVQPIKQSRFTCKQRCFEIYHFNDRFIIRK